jgi:Tfp pilus assembly protein PilV
MMNFFNTHSDRDGFTLIEVMLSLTIGVLLMGSILAIFINYLQNSDHVANWQTASFESSTALEKIVKGDGDTALGIRSFVSDETTCTSDGDGWVISDGSSGYSFTYDAAAETITDGDGNLIAEHVTNSGIGRSGALIAISVEIEEDDDASCSYQTTILMRN